MIAANGLYAGEMGNVMEISPDSRIRANIIIFDANQVRIKSSETTTYTRMVPATSISSTESSQNFTTGFSNIPFLVDGLVLDYEKDINKIFSSKYDVRPMVGIRVLGKLGSSSSSSSSGTASSGLSLSYPAVNSIINGTSITTTPSEAISLRPWGLMGALYLGLNKSFHEKLSISARVGPVLSALDLTYYRIVSSTNTASNFSTSQRAVTKLGFGGFGSIEAGYQITKNFNITTELMYSGFTSGKINTPYYVINPAVTQPATSANVTGYINAPYISDIIGMIGVEYKF